MPLYADIVLPLAQPAYTFAVPEGMHVAEGTAVAVQFGPRKFYTGVVWRVHDRRPPFRTIKSIQRVLYDAPLLSAQQKALWEWIAAYYMCSAGEVMRVALPSLMKPSGDTEEEFAEDEFRPRTECYVALARELHDEGRLHEVFEKLGRRAPKQYEAPAGDRVGGGRDPDFDGRGGPPPTAGRLCRAACAGAQGAYRLHGARTHRRAGRFGVPAARTDRAAARSARFAAGAVRRKACGAAARRDGVGEDRNLHTPDRRNAGAGRRRAAARARNRPDGAADRAHGAHLRQPRDPPIIRNLRTAAARRPTCG